MGFNDFLNHRCDIYHIKSEEKSPGYNLPSSPKFSYPDEPDHSNVECKFGTKSGTATVTPHSPQTTYDARLKLALPWGTDIRVNDKVVDLDSGYEYTAEVPRKIRSHHIVVYVTRRSHQEAL